MSDDQEIRKKFKQLLEGKAKRARDNAIFYYACTFVLYIVAIAANAASATVGDPSNRLSTSRSSSRSSWLIWAITLIFVAPTTNVRISVSPHDCPNDAPLLVERPPHLRALVTEIRKVGELRNGRYIPPTDDKVTLPRLLLTAS